MNRADTGFPIESSSRWQSVGFDTADAHLLFPRRPIVLARYHRVLGAGLPRWH